MSQSNRNDPKRGTASESRYSFYEFDRDFPDDAACLEWLVKHLYPEGITCPKCAKATPHYRVKARPCYACQFCGHHEYPMRGTIFENSATSLRLWFHGFFLMSQTRCGISAKQLERELGVTYKTAWRMFHKIRTLLADDAGELHGEVEVDETYFNRSKRNRPGEPRKLGRSPGARVVVGAVERQGRIVAKHVPSANDQALMSHIWSFVLPDTMIYTDEHPSYFSVGKTGYQHRRIKHTARVYVDGDVHTQTIEGFWSLLKRGISGAYHSVSAKHLQTYVDEYTFRYNHRKDEAGMFAAFLTRVAKDGPAIAG
jgi:transposase